MNMIFIFPMAFLSYNGEAIVSTAFEFVTTACAA